MGREYEVATDAMLMFKKESKRKLIVEITGQWIGQPG